uniref:Succinate dehydrogenase [ubiquinone] cytochrome b small subunit n=1 Tax=Glossina austeni TaxID=7395 RepID=A0A1A9VM39_GLOAU
MQSVISDYMRSAVVGKTLPIVTRVLVIIFSVAALCGLYQLVYDDIGIAPTIKKFWVITAPKEQPEPVSQEVEKRGVAGAQKGT